jgi:hypothetical protein
MRTQSNPWNLWWEKWHCDRVYSKYIGFSLSIFIPPMIYIRLSTEEHTMEPLEGAVSKNII